MGGKRVRIRRGRLDFPKPPPPPIAPPPAQNVTEGPNLYHPPIRRQGNPHEWLQALLNGHQVLLEWRIGDERVHLAEVDLSQQTRHGNEIVVDTPEIVIPVTRTGQMTLHMISRDGTYLRQMGFHQQVVNGDTLNMTPGIRVTLN